VIYPFSNELENKQVKINSDNKNVEHILKVGSKKTTLQKTATHIHSICESQNIQLTPYWIPEHKTITLISRAES
jgi:myosin-crossreactive antigen